MSQLVPMLIFGLPFLADSFTKGYAIIPAFFCAVVVASRKFKARIKIVLICAVLLATAFYVGASTEAVALLAILFLMLPAIIFYTTVFAAAVRLLRIAGERYERFLDGPTNA